MQVGYFKTMAKYSPFSRINNILGFDDGPILGKDTLLPFD
jgi:hypothetical protein